MAELVQTKKTSLAPQDVMMRAVQYFTTGKWRAQSQSERIATFVGRPPIPIGLLILTIIGFMCCIIPGIILYIMAIKKVIQLQNIVVTANPTESGSEVTVKHSKSATNLVTEFVSLLP